MRGGFHPPIGGVTQILCPGVIARAGRDPGECVESEDLDGGVVVAPRLVEDRDEPLLRARDLIPGGECRQQALAEEGLLSASGGAVPRYCRLERCARPGDLSERAQHAPEMHPCERRQAHVSGRFGLLDRALQRGGARLVVTGLALRTAETGDLVRLRLQEAEPPRRLRRASDVEDRIVEPVLDPGKLAEHRVAADVEPRVVDRPEPLVNAITSLDGARAVTGRDRGAGGEQPVRGLIPRPVQFTVERAGAVGQLHRLTELAVV